MVKTGHFEGRLALGAASAAQGHDESTQREFATFDNDLGGARLVAPTDCAGTGHPPRDGRASFTIGRFKTGQSAHRRGRQNPIARTGAETATLTYNDANELLTECYSGGTLNGLTVTSGYDTYLRCNSLTPYLPAPNSYLPRRMATIPRPDGCKR